MINQLPTNIIPFFILGVSVTIFGLRSLYLYHAKRLPLSLYIGLGALLIGVSDLFYSVPFFFTYNNDILKITALIGDLLYYGSIIVMARLIWYLGFSKKVSFYWVLLPYLILIAGALISTMVSWQTIVYTVTENQAYFPVSITTSWFLAAMSTAFVFVGMIFVGQAKFLKVSKQKSRLYIIGFAFLLGGLIVIYNYLFLQGNNTGSFGSIGYIVLGLALFIGIFIISRKREDIKNIK